MYSSKGSDQNGIVSETESFGLIRDPFELWGRGCSMASRVEHQDCSFVVN